MNNNQVRNSCGENKDLQINRNAVIAIVATAYSITESFGANLAKLLGEKIQNEHRSFRKNEFIKTVRKRVGGEVYTQRVEIIAEELQNFLPGKYPDAVKILMKILGPENPNETGMFKHYYWQMPIGKFIEKFGIDDFEISLEAIAEVTKRNTGEYAIRPFIRRYPKKTVAQMKNWARSDNFHLRRLACEGLRPKLPWAPKLEEFIGEPKPVFEILELLKDDPVKFVKKSVANHLTDYIKVNAKAVRPLIGRWRKSKNEHTQWIVKHATRKIR